MKSWFVLAAWTTYWTVNPSRESTQPMKQSIARVLHRLADRFDPAGPRVSNVMNINVTNQRATEDGTGRAIAAEQERLTAAYKRYEAAALDYVTAISRTR